MNKILALTVRNLKEIVRDPLAAVFCLVFPLVMLVVMSLIFAQIEGAPANFEISAYVSGICVFGFTFSMMFVAMLIAGDKNTEFRNRLTLSPISWASYPLSHFLAIVPIVLVQIVLFFAVALCFGLSASWTTLLAVVYLLPSALFYVSLGVLLGAICKNEKQAGPISSIIISAVGILGGVFMPIEGMGALSTIANLLPFSHTVQIGTAAIVGNFGAFWGHAAWIMGYTAIVWMAALIIYKLKK